MTLYRIYEFLFSRWKMEVVDRRSETWSNTPIVGGLPIVSQATRYTRDYIDYKYTNKFDGSTKIKRKYLN